MKEVSFARHQQDPVVLPNTSNPTAEHVRELDMDLIFFLTASIALTSNFRGKRGTTREITRKMEELLHYYKKGEVTDIGKFVKENLFYLWTGRTIDGGINSEGEFECCLAARTEVAFLDPCLMGFKNLHELSQAIIHLSRRLEYQVNPTDLVARAIIFYLEIRKAMGFFENEDFE